MGPASSRKEDSEAQSGEENTNHRDRQKPRIAMLAATIVETKKKL